MTATLASKDTVSLYMYRDSSWQLMGKVIAIQDVEFRRDSIDTTVSPYVFQAEHTISDVPWKTTIPGRISGGFSLSMLFDWDVFDVVFDAMKASAESEVNNYRLAIVDASNNSYLLRFPAIVTQITKSIRVGDKIVCSVSFEFAAAVIKQIHVTDVPDEEAFALMDFYSATGGDDWTDNTGWGTDPVVNNWHGVTVSGGHVTKIELPNNNLAGTVNNELNEIKSTLQVYDVHNNADLYGDLEDFAGFTSLTTLYLSNTEYSGTLADLSGLTSLNILYMYGLENVTGDISNLSGLTSITHLSISETGVDGDISAFSSMSGLYTLWAENLNGLEGDLSSLPSSLRYMSLSNYNSHSTITGSMSDLSSNDWVNLSLYNCVNVNGDIADICGSGHTSLELLLLHQTSVSGDIANLAQHTGLQKLYLNSTQVTGDLGDLHTLTSLTVLNAPFTNIGYSSPSAGLPSEWDNMTLITLNDMNWTQTEVNNFLCDMDSASTSGSGTIDVGGNNLAPTTSGENCALSLQSKGWSVIYNEVSILKDEPDGGTLKGDGTKE